MYKDLRTIFHIDAELANKTYLSRYNNDCCRKLDIKLSGGNAFYILTDDIQKQLIEIRKLDKLTLKYINDLPGIALTHYIKQCLIDEVTSTNDIEGVYSSRQDINNVLENLDKPAKFKGLVKSYFYLSQVDDIELDVAEDIRNLYNKILLDDIPEKDRPDGKIFRKGPVSVYDNSIEIHKGILPEEAIIENVDKALSYLNNHEDDVIVKASVFHYLFGYIHPFYDGNGRLNRFISSYVFAKEFESLLSYSFSIAIKNNLQQYYKAFKTCNHVLNKGDITPFIEYFVSLVKDAIKDLNFKLNEKLVIYKACDSNIRKLKFGTNNKYFHIYDLLLQATLFSEIGISTKDLLNILGITRTTLRNRLKNIDENLVDIKKVGKEKFYSFRDLSVLN